MSCARGCCETQREHYQSLRVLDPARSSLRKVTTDVHDYGSVDVTERWDGQDVTVKPKTMRLKASVQEG